MNTLDLDGSFMEKSTYKYDSIGNRIEKPFEITERFFEYY